MMNYSDFDFKKEYTLESAFLTMKAGQIYAIVGIPVVFIFAFTETFIFKSPLFILVRALAALPAALFLILLKSLFKKKPTLAIPFHALTLACTILMMLGVTIIKLNLTAFASLFKAANVANGLITAIFLTFVAAAGVRKYLPWLLFTPLFPLFLYLYNDPSLDKRELLFFINPLLTAAGACVFAMYQEKKSFMEFKKRKMAELAKLKLKKEIQERKLLEMNLKSQASRDELTNLYNRRMVYPILKKQLHAANIRKQPLTVGFIDVDHLKKVNDTLGHAQGDKLLITVANVLTENIRETDYICRIGGDEFVIIFPNCRETDAKVVIKRAREKLTREYRIDFSYGCSEYNEERRLEIKKLIDEADAEMYTHKLLKSKPPKTRNRTEEFIQPPLF